MTRSVKYLQFFFFAIAISELLALKCDDTDESNSILTSLKNIIVACLVDLNQCMKNGINLRVRGT